MSEKIHRQKTINGVNKMESKKEKSIKKTYDKAFKELKEENTLEEAEYQQSWTW